MSEVIENKEVKLEQNRDLELEEKEAALKEARAKLEKYIKDELVSSGYVSNGKLYHVDLESWSLDRLLSCGIYKCVKNQNEVKYMKSQIEKCERIVEFHNLWKSDDFKPIKDIIESYRKKIKFDDGNDKFSYSLNKNGDITFIDYSFNHYNGFSQPFDDTPWYSAPRFDSLWGYMVYDSKGNVCLSYTNNKDDCGYSSSGIKGIDRLGGNTYWCHFYDNEYMCIDQSFHPSNLYKLVDGKCVLVHTFGEDEHISFIPTLWKKKQLLINSSKIFSVEEDKYVFDAKIGNIETCDYEYLGSNICGSSEDEELNNQSQELLSNYLKDNNLFILGGAFSAEYDGHKRTYNTMCFMDLNGDIVSKLYVISEENTYTEYDTSKETYKEDIEKLKEYYSNELKRKIVRKKAAEKAAQTRKERQKMENTKKFFEAMKAYCQPSTDSIKKTYHPNESKQENK